MRRSSDRVGVKYSDIVVIEEVDDLKNSAVVGLIVGAALFVADVWASSHDGITLNTAGYSVFGALYAGLGAGAGAGIDALIGGNRPIYGAVGLVAKEWLARRNSCSIDVVPVRGFEPRSRG